MAGAAAVAAEVRQLRKTIPLDGPARAMALQLEMGGHNPAQVALLALSVCTTRTRSLAEAYAGPRLTLLLDLAQEPDGAMDAAGLRSLLEDAGITKTASTMARLIAQLERCAGVRLKRFFDLSVAHNVLKQGHSQGTGGGSGSESDGSVRVTVPVRLVHLAEAWGLPANPHHRAVMSRARAIPLHRFWLQRPLWSEALKYIAMKAETLLE